MHPKAADYLALTQPRATGEGILFYQLEVSRAFDLLDQEPDFLEHLDSGYDVCEAARVDFSKNVHWIDVLIVLKKRECEDKNIIVTFDPRENLIVAVSDARHRFRTLEDTSALLPFALSIESHTVDMSVPEQKTRDLNSRRDAFQALIIGALLPVMGVVSPAQAKSTQSNTCPDTNKKRKVNRPKSTSGVTTPGNDQDTKSDDNYVDESYSEKDCVSDTKEDP